MVFVLGIYRFVTSVILVSPGKVNFMLNEIALQKHTQICNYSDTDTKQTIEWLVALKQTIREIQNRSRVFE